MPNFIMSMAIAYAGLSYRAAFAMNLALAFCAAGIALLAAILTHQEIEQRDRAYRAFMVQCVPQQTEQRCNELWRWNPE